MIERRLPVPGIERFLVTESGDVFSAFTGEKRYQHKSKCGYSYVVHEWIVQGKRRRKHFLVHQLVYTAFVGPIVEGMCIDHIDRNRANNSVSNLRLVSPSQNGMNRSKNSNATWSRYVGVVRANKSRYRPRVKKDGKCYFAKTFACETRLLPLQETS